MAGIVGMFGAHPDKPATQKMLKRIHHRGPDSTELHQDVRCSFGVCASDLSKARGNGMARKNEIVVLLDGELYNDRNPGQSDAEVVTDLYKEYGRTFPAHLNGVFACAVFDGQNLLLARDSVGVRPLYWAETDTGDICFASELKALVGIGHDVQELGPSTTFVTGAGIAGYLPIFPEVELNASFEEAVKKVRETVLEAVRRRLEDKAVGACLLSGGLDSSIIAAAANHLGASDLPLVTIGMEGAPDVENARVMADSLDMEHRVYIFDSDEIVSLVPRAVRTLESFDEDCISGTISNLIASSIASEYTNCTLSGEGGDELFGGYHLLKQLDTQQKRLKMMDKLIDVAYNTALQRLDRAMMGNSINYRTPFIDTDVIALAMQLPVRWKISLKSDTGKEIEKYILREAFKDLLPERIYTRDKLRFAAGTGTDDLMDQVARKSIEHTDFNEKTRKTPEGYYLNSPKELWYYRLFKQEFPDPAFERLAGRWNPDK
ncbi:MAG: asparagine synthase-related protein [Pirellulaceae bacterium]